jgi:hypothetical protein
VHLRFPDIIASELQDGQIKDPGPLADPFDRLAYDTGMGWREIADQKTVDKSYGFDLSLGPGVGFNLDDSHLKLNTNKAEMLDHPADGQRSYVDFPQCTAAVNQ